MGHNVSSSKIVVQPITSDNVNIKQTENGLNSSGTIIQLSSGGQDSGTTFKRTQEFNVKVDDDGRICDITGCCMLTDGCLVLSDFSNKRLKKLDPKGHVGFIDLPGQPSDVCYLGKNENKVVVCIGDTLQYVSVKGKLKLSQSVTLSHSCNGIACHGDYLYIVDDSSVLKYTNHGDKKETLFTGSSLTSRFCHICVGANGTKLYVTDEQSGLLTIDSSGNNLATLTDPDLKEAQGVCVDSDGSVLVSGFDSDTVIKVDTSGKKKIQTVIQDGGDISDPKCLCIDSRSSKLYVGQWNDKLTVFHMK